MARAGSQAAAGSDDKPSYDAQSGQVAGDEPLPVWEQELLQGGAAESPASPTPAGADATPAPEAPAPTSPAETISGVAGADSGAVTQAPAIDQTAQ
jgi:small subunit ribosomal protein S2